MTSTLTETAASTTSDRGVSLEATPRPPSVEVSRAASRGSGRTPWGAAWAPLAAASTAALTIFAALPEQPHLNMGIVAPTLILPYLLVAAILIFLQAHPSLNVWTRIALGGLAALLSFGSILIDLLAALALGMMNAGGFYVYEPGSDAFLACVAALLGMVSLVTAVYRGTARRTPRG